MKFSLFYQLPCAPDQNEVTRVINLFPKLPEQVEIYRVRFAPLGTRGNRKMSRLGSSLCGG